MTRRLLPLALGPFLLTLPALGLPPAAQAAEEAAPVALDELEAALTQGTASLDVRYRFEHVDDDGFARNANANTLRTRLGYQTGTAAGFSAMLEFEHTESLGAEDFNSTTNARTAFPVVADPDSTELNQAYLAFTGLPDSRIAAGRQRIIWDNHRFIGNVGFRQNEQTYDAVLVSNQSLPETQIAYFYALHVNRIFGSQSSVGTFNTDNHSFRIEHAFAPEFNAVGYGHFFDVDDDETLSSRTLGLRASGTFALKGDFAFLYAAEYAHQSDRAGNPNDVDLGYTLIEPAIRYGGFTGLFGYEVLGGNGTAAFQTPFATLHKFQGWADKFLTTPANGIEDLYGGLKYVLEGPEPIAGLALSAIYHDFDAEDASIDYGREIDLEIAKTWYKHFTTTVKYANYDADQFSTDTEKLWLEVQIKY